MADAPRYLLGLDAGNTIIKAVLFTLDGKQVAAHGIDGATHKPAAGMVERCRARATSARATPMGR